MIRALVVLALVAGGFAGGFYVGVQYKEQQLVSDPEAFFEAYKVEMKRTAKDKYERIKAILLEDTRLEKKDEQ